MDKFNIRISKLSLESDGNITGDTFISKPDINLEEKLGVIFGLVELFNLPEGFLDDLVEILADLKTEYYLPPFDNEYGVEKRFEDCLARANRRINKSINDCIEKVDLRNINVLIGLTYKNKIHLSHIGQAKALLYHEKKKHGVIIVDILSQAGEKKPKADQEKMFSNLISGEITTKDDVIICNDSVFEYISQSDLGGIISENASNRAISEISSSLKETSGGENTNFYCLLLEPDYQDEEESEPEKIIVSHNRVRQTEPRHYTNEHPTGSIERLLKTQHKTERYLAPSLMPNWQRILIIIGRSSLQLLKKIGIYLFIAGKFLYKYIRIGLIKLSRLIAARFKARRAATAGPKEMNLETEPQNTEELTEVRVKIEAEGGEAIETVDIGKEITKFSLDESEFINELEKSVETFQPAFTGNGVSDRINNKLNRLAGWLFGLRTWQKALLIIVFILAFLFSQSVVWLGRSEETVTAETGIESLTKQIEDKINNAEAQNIFNDENGAKSSLQEAKTLLAQIPDKRKYDSERNRLQERISGIVQALQKISYLENPKIIADLAKVNASAQTTGLARVGNTLLSFDNNNQNLYLVEEASGQATSTVWHELSQVRKIVALNGQSAVILNGEKEVYIFDLSKKTLTKALVSDVKITDMEVYEGKVYLLKAEKNQVYRHTVSDNKLNTGATWISSGDATGGVAIALDGGLYFGRAGGEIRHFTKSKMEDKTWTAIEPPLTNISQLATTPQSNYLYVLDAENKRVVAYDSNGVLRKQYSSKSFNSVASLALMEKEKKIYLLSDNKIYQIDIDF